MFDSIGAADVGKTLALPEGEAGVNAGVGGRSDEAGKAGAPNAGVGGAERRVGAIGGMRAALPSIVGAAAGSSTLPNDSLSSAGALGAGDTVGMRIAGVAAASAFRDGTVSVAAASESFDALAGAPAPRDTGGDATRATVDEGKSSAQRMLAPTAISPPHTAHRARRFADVTRAGSTRNTE